MTTMLAIDPGDVHVGVARFRTREDGTWECWHTQEYDPDTFSDLLWSELINQASRPDVLVYERFVLYPHLKDQQVGSDFKTSQLIGVIRWMVRYTNLLPDVNTDDDRPLLPQVRLVDQPAAVQKPTLAALRAQGQRSRAKVRKTGPHTLSAELHGWYWVLRGDGAQLASQP